MTRFLFGRRLNFVDSVGSFLVGAAFARGRYIEAAVFFALTVAVSVTGEQRFKA